MASKNPLEISMKDTITAIMWVPLMAVILFMFFVMGWTLLPIALFGLGVVVAMGISAWGSSDINKMD